MQVKKGDRLFVIDLVVAQADVDRAEGALAEARSRYENLLKGKRPEEKEITTAQRHETELVEKEGWYHGNAPVEDGVRGTL